MKRRIRRSLLLACLFGLVAVLTGCGGAGESTAKDGAGGAGAPQVGTVKKTGEGSYIDLTPKELKAMLDQKDFFLADVHTPPQGRLPKTDVRVPYDKVEQQIGKFPSDKSAKIVLTCLSGGMSTEASQTLVKLGYTNVYNLAGGMYAWEDAGYELIPEDK